ncbi:WhiB family transcriptional regulator [Streptomyces xiamenensis]|uniref:WhiB family transcriptional regulator n=1 Tax=Streptomyces xiamenensis TaxID=408015 RepID=UPI0035E2804D
MPAAAIGQPKLIEADPRVPEPDYTNAPCRQLSPAQADELAFPERMSPAATAFAKAMCRACPQAPDCLLYVLANPKLHPEGVRAATTPNEREELRNNLCKRLGNDWVTTAARSRRAARSTSAATRTSGPRTPISPRPRAAALNSEKVSA